MNRRSRIIAYSVLVVLTLMIGANIFAQSPQTSYRSDQPRQETTACGGQSCEAVARGLRAFLDRDLQNLAYLRKL